jgi:isopentenyl-diphosphate delta-isomerase type 1
VSADELLDVVDAGDRVIATATRAVVHRDGLRHRAAHILLYDDTSRLYLQRRAFSKECSPGCWDTSAAGHLGAGESYATAAQRELEEELGIGGSPLLEPLFKLPASVDTGHEFVWVFRTTTTQSVRPDPDEIIDGRWCSEAEVTDWVAREPASFTGSFRLIWSLLRVA